MSVHIQSHQSSCSFKVVQCPNRGCKEKLTKQDLKIHVTLECSWRKISCEYCKALFIPNQKQVCDSLNDARVICLRTIAKAAVIICPSAN